MTKALWICPKCGASVPLKHMPSHVCGEDKISEKPNFEHLTHKEVLEYYMLHPEEIEEGLTILFKEFPVLKGKIDLVGRDKQMRICLIEVVHRSHMDKSFWVSRLRKYQGYLRQVWTRIFQMPSDRHPTFRLLLKFAGKPTEEIE